MKKSGILVSVLALSFLMVSPLTAQDRARRRRAPDSPPPAREGQAEPRRGSDPPQRRRGQERERERAESRRQRQWPSSSRGGYAVPRSRPLPRPRPQYGPYNRMMHRGQYYFWRPYPRIWIRPNTCVAGYWDWDWDPLYDEWVPVWIEGYCNVRGYRPPPGFYFWFDFGR